MRIFFFLLFLHSAFNSYTQSYHQWNSGEIYNKIQKFNFLGSALYVAAHPDDENTRLISYLSNGLHARTAYLSLTRGDGGQNLIGTEIRELLGVLRSQELQMARSIDGGQQFFTRANDFGYSKHPDETLEIWNKDQVFADLIYAIRKFRPDVIINRFDHRTPGKSHGHHTSSAMLSVESFDLTADASIFPEQLNEVDLWQPRRQFMNTSWWFYGSRENFAKADKTNMVSVDVGEYYPNLGKSNNEISSLARSKHRSQGFGSAGQRGSYQEFLELLNGDMPTKKEDLFDGINTSWTRLEGGAKLQDLSEQLVNDFDYNSPKGSIPILLEMRKEILNIKDAFWKALKLKEVDELIIQSGGFFIEASIDQAYGCPGDSIEVQLELTNRSDRKATIKAIQINETLFDINEELEFNTQNKWFKQLKIKEAQAFSNPYWLDEKGSLGTYKVDDQATRILPQSKAAFEATYVLAIEGQELKYKTPLIYRYVDPAIGEIRQPFSIVPPAVISFDKDLYLMSQLTKDKLVVKIKAHVDNLKANLNLKTSDNWKIIPATQQVNIANKGFEQTYVFELVAPKEVSQSEIIAEVEINGKTYNKSLTKIEYDHIPIQTILLPAKAQLVKVPLAQGGLDIGYLMGAGDKMPESLQSVGYKLTMLETKDLSKLNLNKFDAIVIGVRAYNTQKELKLYNQYLFDYADGGGTVITQYNTSRRLNFDDLAPYPIKLSRKRVTDEFAEIRVLAPDHPVLNTPNKISQEDFKYWVQERGLYFPEEWDESYKAILSSNDKGEDPLDGSLLVAEHGKGYFVYTSLSWFRQLPAGVPGAFRLFANLLALSSGNEAQRP